MFSVVRKSLLAFIILIMNNTCQTCNYLTGNFICQICGRVRLVTVLGGREPSFKVVGDKPPYARFATFPQESERSEGEAQ
jgi:hypothetical protein